MRKLLRSAAVSALALAIGGGVVVVSGAAAQAAVLGTITFSPATGSDSSSITLTTNALCDAGTNVQASMSGGPAGNVFSNVNVSPNQSQGSVSNGTGYSIPLTDTMRGFAQAAGFTTLGGKYDFTIQCKNAFSGTFGTFTGSIWFTSNTAYQSTDPAGTPTSTSLGAAPASPQNQGTSVTFTATVSPAAATGSVQFKDGANNLGSAAAVSGGTASISTSALSAGTHSITAAFTGTGGYQNSTSSALSYTINAVVTPTTTSLGAPATAAQFSPVLFTATVSPSASGSVAFKEGATTLGTSPVSSGTSTFSTSSLSVGSHSVTATFTPTDPASFSGSTSAPVSVQITAFAGVTASEQIQTTIDAGSLTISVADTSPVVLPTPTLDADAGLLVTTGDIHPVTVTDTRAGSTGFTVNGQVTDFSSGPNTINGYDLGWAPSRIDSAVAQTITPGPVVNPANGLAPGVTPGDPALGLKTSRVLATGTGLGTTHLGATLTLKAPTSTPAGTYVATLTLTAI